MAKFYDAMNRGFYDVELGGACPEGSVEVPESYWQSLLAAQSSGAAIEPDRNGYPRAVFSDTVSDLRQVLSGNVSEICLQRQAAGCILSDGMMVNTDLQGQALIQMALMAVNTGRETIDWKDCDGNWRIMNAKQVHRMAAQVSGYLIDCLSVERQHHETIALLADNELDDYDITCGWPGQ